MIKTNLYRCPFFSLLSPKLQCHINKGNVVNDVTISNVTKSLKMS